VRSIFKPKLTLTEQEAKSGLRALTLQGTSGMGLDAITGGGFLAAYALALGASNSQIGVLASLPFLLQPLQVPAIALVEKFRRRKLITVLTMAVANSLWVPAALIPFVIGAPGAPAMSALLTIVALRSAITPIFNVPWLSWLRDFVPPDIRGKFFARRLAYASALGMALGLGGALFADFWKEEAGSAEAVAQGFAYPILAASLTLGILSWVFIARMPEPQMLTVADADRQPVLKSIIAPFRDQNYGRLLRFKFLTTFAMQLAVPFFAVYMIEVIGLPVSAVMAFTALSQLSNILFLGVWGRMVDRYGAKSVLSAATSLYFLVILGWAFTTLPDRYFLTIPLLAILHVMAGIATAGMNVTQGTIAMKLSPQGQATSYLASSSLSISMGAALGPLVGGQFADFFADRSFRISLEYISGDHMRMLSPINLSGFDFLFAISFLLGMFVLGSLALVKEEGEAPFSAVMDELFAPMRNIIRPMSSVPGMSSLAEFPVQTARHSRLPGLDVAIGVTAYQVAESARVAAKAASAGRDITVDVADAVEEAVGDMRRGVRLAGSQVADMARNVARGSVQSAETIEEDTKKIVGASVRGILRALAINRESSKSAAYGAGFGAMEAAVSQGMDVGEAAAAVMEAVHAESGLIHGGAPGEAAAEMERGVRDATDNMTPEQAEQVREALDEAGGNRRE
jgi:MFS family permease